jgi:uncharacterized membrane protein
MDTKKRSLLKSLTWRAIGILILSVIAFSITNDWKEMTGITLLFHSIRFVLYYLHERIWEHITWGKLRGALCAIPVKRKLDEKELEMVRETLRSFQAI